MSTDPFQELPVLVARSAGVVALVLAALATFVALAVTAGRADAVEGRRVGADLGVAALLAVALHGMALLLTDLPVGLAGVLLPFASGYRPFAVMLGVLAAWALLAAVVVAKGRPRAGSPAALLADALGPAVVAVAGIHALTAGADAGSWWMTLGALALAAGLLAFGGLALQARGAPSPSRPAVTHEPEPWAAEAPAEHPSPVRDAAEAPTHAHEPVPAAARPSLWERDPGSSAVPRGDEPAERWDDEAPSAHGGSLWSGHAGR